MIVFGTIPLRVAQQYLSKISIIFLVVSKMYISVFYSVLEIFLYYLCLILTLAIYVKLE